MKVTGMLLVSLRGIVNCRYVNLTLGVWDGESLYIYKKCPDTDHTEISLRQPHWSPLGFHLNFPMSIPVNFMWESPRVVAVVVVLKLCGLAKESKV